MIENKFKSSKFKFVPFSSLITMSSPSSSEAEPPLFKCVSNRFYYIPRRYRVILGQFIFAVFGLLFLIVPFNIGILFISISLGMTKVASIATAFLGFQMLQFLVPCHEWPIVRSFFQICYDAVDFSTNLDDARRKDVMTKTAAGQQYILAMHPHAIIPLHALLWAAYCDQYLSDKTSNIQLYGFGAVADVVLYLPFLRTILGWLSVSSATYSIVRRGLVDVSYLHVSWMY